MLMEAEGLKSNDQSPPDGMDEAPTWVEVDGFVYELEALPATVRQLLSRSRRLEERLQEQAERLEKLEQGRLDTWASLRSSIAQSGVSPIGMREEA